MPCRCDMAEPNDREQESKKVSKLICYLFPLVNQLVPPHTIIASKDMYGDAKHLDKDTKLLCDTIHNLTKEQQDRYVYDGRNANARKLADWWDRHQKADKEREKVERTAGEILRLRKQALAKLTKVEKDALDLT